MKNIRPFLRWAGGKRWADIPSLLKSPTRMSYYEPFVGSGAWLIQMMKADLIEPGQLVIGDLAPESAVIWRSLLVNPVRVAAEARRSMENTRTQPAYDRLVAEWDEAKNESEKLIGRQLCRFGGIAVAINRLSYKGLLRVNKLGNFNTSYGYLPDPTLDDVALIAVGDRLQNLEAAVFQADWRVTSDVAGKLPPGVISVDPPYIGDSENGIIHTRYTKQGWNALDRLQLSTTCSVMHKMGWSVIATDTGNMDAWKAWEWAGPKPVQRSGGMSDGTGTGRAKRSEILMVKQVLP